MLKVAIHSHHPLLHGLYILHPLLLILLVTLIQLHLPPIGLLELSLHRFIQCIDLTTDVLCISLNSPNFRHRVWRIYFSVRGPHTINPHFVVVVNCLGLYFVITNRWASMSAPVLLLRSGLG